MIFNDKFRISIHILYNFQILIFFSRTTGTLYQPNLEQLKHSWKNGAPFLFFYIFFITNKGSLNSQKEIMISSTSWYIYSFVQMCILVGTRFAGERCGPWASCLYSYPYNSHLLASVWQCYPEYSAIDLFFV